MHTCVSDKPESLACVGCIVLFGYMRFMVLLYDVDGRGGLLCAWVKIAVDSWSCPIMLYMAAFLACCPDCRRFCEYLGRCLACSTSPCPALIPCLMVCLCCIFVLLCVVTALYVSQVVATT